MERVEQPQPAKAPEPSKEDLATHDYQMLIPEFEKIIEDRSANQLRRVIMALMKYPLEARKVRFSYPEEAELFDMGMKIFDCKMILMKAVMDLKADEIKKILEETGDSPNTVAADVLGVEPTAAPQESN